MFTTTLGRTGLTVSRMGLGCGGHSRLGMGRGESKGHAARIVREAIYLGVNFIDTAESYGTEEAVGEGIAGLPRERLVLSTKVGTTLDGRPATSLEIRDRVEGCLKRLGTDYVDVLHLHGVMPSEYGHALDVLYPALADLKAQGKIRHIGITEAFIRDTDHRMLASATTEGPWEVVMVGFNLLNPSARVRVLPQTQALSIGTLCMFAVRRALSQPETLRQLLTELFEKGEIQEQPSTENPLGFLGPDLQEAAYRFCLWEPGVDVVLSGTGNIDHLRQNAKALQEPPLPEASLERLRIIFGNVDSVSGN
ncbi:hypothetical protein BH11ARM2_BH11ARM2_22710 [soil metagenome]